MQDFLEIGQIVNTFGINGLLKIKPFTDNIKRFDKLKKVYIVDKNNLKEFVIEEVKYHKGLVLLQLKGIYDMNTAEKYKGMYLKIKREDAVQLPKNSYFIADLLGLQVYDENNILLGYLEDIFPTGSNDVYVVKTQDGKQILLPAIKSVIKNIDLQTKKITVKLIEGLV